MTKEKKATSWEGVSTWYNKAVGSSGLYYHDRVVLPKILPILASKENASFLDLACGQGILSRHLPPSSEYTGVDISPSLIKSAKEQNQNKKHTFLVSDITKPLPIQKKDFDFCTLILAAQNLLHPLNAFQNAFNHLSPNGQLVIVMNHPCFRIPRQSSWGIDSDKDIQYRRIDSYYSSLKIPIQSHPSKGSQSQETLSFHHSLSQWTFWLKEAGFMIEWMDELCSDKKSTGKCAKREDRSRKEIPLFLLLVARKPN